jgi:hypothetical protein
MKPGTQIAYIPTHAEGNLAHPDTEFGFVMSRAPADDAYFCRFWNRHEPGNLRTRSCSELCPFEALREVESVPQFVVDGLMWLIEKGYL